MISENFLAKTITVTNFDISKYDRRKCYIDETKYTSSFDKIKEGTYYIKSKSGGREYICGSYKFYHPESRLIGKGLSSCRHSKTEIDRYGDDPIFLYKNVYLICKINDEYKEVYIQELEFNEKPILIYKLCFVSNLKPNTEYIISNFSKTENNNKGIIVSEGIKYYINEKVLNTLETYFKCEDDKIICIYNNKKEIAKLTLVTEDEIITEDEIKMLHQSLKLEIGDKSFTFYINNHNLVNYKKEGKYCFLTMYIYDDLIYGNTIYGYEFKENKYYCLKNEEKLILNNINQEIAKNFRKMKNQDLYTYLLSNNKKYGMIINIDEYKNITYKLSKLNDKCFKSLLDISLLKPTNEWDKEFWDKEPCNINDIDEFNGVMEGFDDEEDDNDEESNNNNDNNYREVDKFDSIDEEFDNEGDEEN